VALGLILVGITMALGGWIRRSPFRNRS